MRPCSIRAAYPCQTGGQWRQNATWGQWKAKESLAGSLPCRFAPSHTFYAHGVKSIHALRRGAGAERLHRLTRLLLRMSPTIRLPLPLRTLAAATGLSTSALCRLERVGIDVTDPTAIRDYYAIRRPGRQPSRSATVFAAPETVASRLAEIIASLA